MAQGLCLAVEALPGTDAMLAAVAEIAASLRPDPGRGRGLFYKAPKPGQDRRIDLPALGVETIRRAAAAGLGGVAWQAGAVQRPFLLAKEYIPRNSGPGCVQTLEYL